MSPHHLLLLMSGVAIAQSTGTFSATGSLTTERMGHTATLLTNGKVLIAGGSRLVFTPAASLLILASTEIYNPATGTFSAMDNMSTPRHGHTATPLPDGKVLIAGGSAFEHGAMGSAELYDPSTETFTATGVMTAIRRGHTATLLNNGKVLMAGGYDGDYPESRLLASAELYDPSTGTFTSTGSMTSKAYRDYRTATLLSNGKVLIPRSVSDEDPAPAELYDPDTGTFSLTSEMGHAYKVMPVTSSLLTNGKVLVTLDYACDPADGAELYDPAAGTFTVTGNMTAFRGSSTASLLPDGTVLLAARDFAGKYNAELYDLATGKFSPTGRPLSEREGHAATLLPDGTVLMSGGWRCCGYSINTAEIYRPAVLVLSPVLFSFSGDGRRATGDGRGAGAIFHAGTSRLVSASDPAVAGEALEIYGSGLVDGSVIPPQVAIGGRMAEVLYFGKAPGFTNLNQVNVRVPSGIAAGPAIPVRWTYLARPSNEVTIGLR